MDNLNNLSYKERLDRLQKSVDIIERFCALRGQIFDGYANDDGYCDVWESRELLDLHDECFLFLKSLKQHTKPLK